MILLYISLAVSLFDIAVQIMTVGTIHDVYKRRYPNSKIPKRGFYEKLLNYTRLVAVAICPILNLALAYVLVFKHEDLCESTIRDIRKEVEREEVENDA